MSAHTMTPIREEEVEHTMSANIEAPNLKQEADVNVNLAENPTVLVNEEEVMDSSSASTIVPNHEEAELSSGTIVIAYFYQVPSVKWHPDLEMMSKAGLTQGQYERKVLNQGYVECFILFVGYTYLIHTSSRLHVELAMPTRRATPIFSLSCSLTRSTWSSLFVNFRTHLLTSCHYITCKDGGRLVGESEPRTR